MRFPFPSHALVLLLALFTLASLSGCDRSRALGVRPDVSATWDVMHDDVIDVEVRSGGEVHRGRVPAKGGRVSFHDAGSSVELEIDCQRPELICPQELFARELVLDNRMGDMNDDGDQLALSFEGEGEGPCQLMRGSLARANVVTQGSAKDGDWVATMLTGGSTRVVLSAGCFQPTSDLPSGAQIVLSSGFTAARR